MQQIVDFILELDKLKGVTRKTRPLGLDRYENSAEHSWQIALLAVSLAHHAETAIDLNRVACSDRWTDLGAGHLFADGGGFSALTTTSSGFGGGAGGSGVLPGTPASSAGGTPASAGAADRAAHPVKSASRR